MNLKLLFPVYRSRYKWIEKTLEKYAKKEGRFGLALSLGCGEGEGDPVIAKVSENVTACDINSDDIAHAKSVNGRFENIHYLVEDATGLTFPDNHFDLIVCSEVIEHIGLPADRILAEIRRVLKPGKFCIFTYPTRTFPFTYDPINNISAVFGRERIIPWGAYAFGHDYLIDNYQFKDWCSKNGLEIIEETGLSGYLVGLTEMYWTGVLQAVFKKNASNQSKVSTGKSMSYRPAFGDPKAGMMTDFLLWLDRTFFMGKKRSILRAYVLRKST